MSAGTIFALSSGQPPAAIAIVRISGLDAQAALIALAGRLPPPRTASLAILRDPNGNGTLDQALILFFPGPETATGEDLVELHLHGGRAVVQAVLSALRSMAGLRDAESGEFTRRAFMNGRLDLNSADGLADLLSAETEWQRRTATHMFTGGFGRQIESWRGELLKVSAMVEAELDFSDEDDVGAPETNLVADGCDALRRSIDLVLAVPSAEKLREGLRIVFGGPPNSGKSSLFNAFIDRDAAIVSDIAGTTRDIIEAPIAWGGIPFVLVDTAGIREESHDSIEQIGIERARNAFGQADMIVWLGAEGEGPDHPYLIEVDAKSDCAYRTKKSNAAFAVSAVTSEGLGQLKDKITELGKSLLPPADQYAVNARQRRFLTDARDALSAVSNASDLLIAGEELRRARLALDALTGRTHTEDVLDNLFGRFCIGK